MIIVSRDINEVRKQIHKAKQKNPNEEIVVKAQDGEFNRKILEMKGVNVLLSPEIHEGEDKSKQRDSGLNEFLCRLSKKNNVKIAIDLEAIKKLDKKQKAIVLSRVIQNMALCKKTKAKIILWPKNKYKKQDIMAFITSLKGSTEMGKNTFV